MTCIIWKQGNLNESAEKTDSNQAMAPQEKHELLSSEVVVSFWAGRKQEKKHFPLHSLQKKGNTEAIF